MKNFLLLLFTGLFFACQPQKLEQSVPFSPTFEQVAPEEVDLISDSLALIIPHLQMAIDSQWIAGGVALVARQGKIAYYESVGHSDEEKQQKLQQDAIFRMASMTKPITSAAVMQLVEQGKVELHDPVSEYIPEFNNTRVVESFNKSDSSYTTRPADRPITIHHLLTHTSGLPYAVFDPVAGPIYAEYNIVEGWTTDSVVLADNIAKLAQVPLIHDPGERWTYGTNIDVLGRVIEVVSGMPLNQYLRENIFSPLGMSDTWFYLPDNKASRLVDVWHTPQFKENSDAVQSLQIENYPVEGAKTLYMGGAGLSGTAKDYFFFCDAMRQKGIRDGNRILKAETVDMMTRNQIDTLQLMDGLRFGYGFAVYEKVEDWQRSVGSYHWAGFWQTIFWIDPEQDLIVILCTNAIYGVGDKLFNRFEEIVNHSIAGREVTASIH